MLDEKILGAVAGFIVTIIYLIYCVLEERKRRRKDEGAEA